MNTQDYVLKWLAESSWQAGCMALCLFVVLSIFRGSVPPRWRHALWLLVACRLLLPALPSSPVSAYQIIPASPAVAWEQALPETPAPPFLEPPAASPEPAPATAVSGLLPWRWDTREIIFFLWQVGVTAFILRLGVKQHLFYRHFRSSRRTPSEGLWGIIASVAREAGLSQPPPSYLLDSTAGPSLFGIFRPCLLLPSDVQTRLQPEQLRLVVLHECMHLKRYDLWTHLMTLFVSVTHWWNPLAWWLVAKIREERELATDAAVLEILRQDQQKEYGETLLTLAQSEEISIGGLQPTIGIFERHADLESRLRQSAGFVRSKPLWSVVGLLCVIAVIPFLLSRNRIKSTEDQPAREVEAVLPFEESGDPEKDGTAIWEKVKEKYANCDSFYCEAEEITTNDKPESLSGSESKFVLRFQRPNLMRLDFMLPSSTSFTPDVSSFFTKDGRYFGIRSYKREIKEFKVIENGIAEISGSISGFHMCLMLLGKSQSFDGIGKVVGNTNVRGHECYLIECSRNPLEKYVFAVNKKTFAIHQFEVVSETTPEMVKAQTERFGSSIKDLKQLEALFPKEGYTTTITSTFTTVVFDKKMAVKDFVFEDPKRPYTLPPPIQRSEAETKMEKGVSFLQVAKDRRTPNSYREAETLFSEVIQAEPKNSEAWSRRCEARVGLRDYHGAISDANEALELLPGYWHSLMYRGQAYFGLGQYDDALADYNTILKNDNRFFWPPELKAYCYLAMGQLDKAYKNFSSSNWNDRPHVKHRMGLTRMLMGKTKEAANEFRDLHGLWSEHGICVAAYVSGDSATAGTMIEQLCKKNPGWLDGAILRFAIGVQDGKKVAFVSPTQAQQPWQVAVRRLGEKKETLEDTLKQVVDAQDPLKTRLHQADAYLLAGYQALQGQEKKEALEHFIKSAQHGQMLSHTYILARHEALRLDPTLEPAKLLPQPMFVTMP